MDKAILGRGKLMRELSSEEFKVLAAEVRSYNQQHPFSYDRREFQGRRYWEGGVLSCLISGAKIPSGITPNLFKVPRNRIIRRSLYGLIPRGLPRLKARV
jgi:hypothetical protein